MQSLKSIFQLLGKLKNLITPLFANFNWAGWTIAVAVAISFVGLWLEALNVSWSYISDAVSTAVSGGSVFGSLPAASLWLLQQAFPVQLFFTLTVTYLLFRISAAKLLAIAITASRKLKG